MWLTLSAAQQHVLQPSRPSAVRRSTAVAPAGAASRSPIGSGDYSQAVLGRNRSPGRGGSLAASWNCGAGRPWPGPHHGPPSHLQLVDRASSPLTLPADGSLPPGEQLQHAVLEATVSVDGRSHCTVNMLALSPDSFRLSPG